MPAFLINVTTLARVRDYKTISGALLNRALISASLCPDIIIHARWFTLSPRAPGVLVILMEPTVIDNENDRRLVVPFSPPPSSPPSPRTSLSLAS